MLALQPEPPRCRKEQGRVIVEPKDEFLTEYDKRLIVEHIDELFGISGDEHRGMPADRSPITESDKRLIMWHVDELFLI